MSFDNAPQGTPSGIVRQIGSLHCFADLSPALLEEIGRNAAVVTFAPGDSLVAGGEFDGSQLYGLISGKARMVKPAARAGDMEVYEVKGGDVVGLPEFLAFGTGSPNGLSLSALTEVEAVILQSGPLKTLLSTSPEVAATMLRHVAHRLLAALSGPETGAGPERRIYQHLLSLVRREDGRFVINAMPRHAALAEKCGCTDREAAEAIAVLIDNDVARREYPGLVIDDMPALRAACF